jgi:hypothetical protein
MRQRNDKGFLLTLVIVALAMLGTIMAVLTAGANTILFHADTAYLQAVERNLVASGLAWAQNRLSAGAETVIDKPFELDTGAIGAPNATLNVRILNVQGNTASVRVETSCRKGRRTLDTSCDYTINLL